VSHVPRSDRISRKAVSLSVCLITADPPARVATILEPLRPHAQEIVIAADSRVDCETLAGFGAIADKLFNIEFVQSERHLAWLCAQCEGDWILRLDGDEVPSQAFVRRLPELLNSREVEQFWIPRAWLYPYAERVLADAPWSTDFVNRLTRNDGTLRISGQQHTYAEPVTPCEYIEEPLYHLDLLTNSREQRLDKAVRYEVARPKMPVAGGGRINEAFYLPELRKSLKLRPVPAEDRGTIAQALAGSPAPVSSTPAENAPYVSLEETDRMWEGRKIRPDTYRASIEPREPTLVLAPSERRHVLMRVRNEGGERWPANLGERPLIRLSYHWRNADGSMHTPEGPRSAFPRTVSPGECILAPLHVDAPAVVGEYVLEVDIVHEHRRWFKCSRRIPVRVEHPPGLPPVGTRLRETDPIGGRGKAACIPHTIHRVWLGGEPMPEEHKRFGDTFAQHHPDWEMRLWTDEDLPGLGIGAKERTLVRTQSELSNLIRYEVMRQHGGVYVDTDVECLRPLTTLLEGIDAFAALEAPGRIGTAVLGSTAGHRVFERAARLARLTLDTGVNSADANGPYFLTLIIEQEPTVAIFGANLFYPYRWDEPERRYESFPDAFAVHHWTQSWVAEEDAE
jgi:inositol phosphorylceramide mannosyltransferase catalytic subunit